MSLKSNEEVEKEFDGKFRNEMGGVVPKHRDGGKILRDDLLTFILSLRKADMEAVRGLIEGKKDYCEWCTGSYDETCAISVKNHTISDLLQQLPNDV